MKEAAFRIAPDRIAFAVRLTPKGGRDAVEGWAIGADGLSYLKARVSALPHDGEANEALLVLLARLFGIAKSRVKIIAGQSARIKRVEVEGDAAALAARMAQWEKTP